MEPVQRYHNISGLSTLVSINYKFLFVSGKTLIKHKAQRKKVIKRRTPLIVPSARSAFLN